MFVWSSSQSGIPGGQPPLLGTILQMANRLNPMDMVRKVLPSRARKEAVDETERQTAPLRSRLGLIAVFLGRVIGHARRFTSIIA